MPFQQAGFPDTKEILSGEPVDDPGIAPEVEGDAPAPQKPKKPMQGFWLTEDPEKVAKDIDKRWEAQNKGQQPGIARGELNERRRDGDAYSKLIKNTDEDTYKVYTPKGIEDAPPSLNKTDDLCVKVVSNLTVDPPKPECEPASDSDEDRSAAEFSTRVLMNESTESGFNIPDFVRGAEDIACSWGTGYVYAYTDRNGGGFQPREVMAPADAMQVGPDGQPVPLPPQIGPDGVPIEAPPSEPKLRYVGEDQVSIVDDPQMAQKQWLPKVCGEILTRKNLRMIPETATGIRDAQGVLIASITSQLGDLKAQFPDTVGTMQPDDLRKLVSYRPEIAKKLLPKHAGDGQGTKGEQYDPAKGPPDDALVFTITGYMRGSYSYPLGAYVVMAGGKYLLHREEWKETVKGKNGQPMERAMDIPVAAFRQFKDTKNRDPHGRGLVDRVGDGDPLVAFAIGAIVEYLHRVNNPHLFVPIGSGIQPKALNLPRGVPIPFNPAGGGKPQQEDIQPLPDTFMEFIQFIRADQDSVSGLEQAAQGVSSASVQSGKHAQQIIEQALVALSGVKSEMESGYTRLCRILLQLIRRDYTVPQRIKIVGDDGAYKEREWTGADLGSTVDVKIMAGTSTMLAASAKSSIALEKFQLGAISQEDYQRAEEGNVRTLIGAQDNPHKTRVRGQISAWNDGPPEGWAPAAPQVDPTTGQPPVDAATGQPIPPPVDPANPFADARLVDEEQAVAIVRHAELSRAMGGSKFASKPPEWQQYLMQAYDAARRAAGVSTLAEQAMAAQQQAMQQQQADADADDRKSADGDKKHAQSMEKQQMAGEQKSAQEQQRADNQMAVQSLSPATSGAPQA